MLIADGNISSAEDDILENTEIAYELGLAPMKFRGIVQTLCEDYVLGSLQAGHAWTPVPESVYAALMAEIDDVRLQHLLLRVCRDVANADDHWADGEMAVLGAVMTHWPLAARDRISSPTARLSYALPTAVVEPANDAGTSRPPAQVMAKFQAPLQLAWYREIPPELPRR